MAVLTSPFAGIGITLSYKLSAGTFVPLVELKDDCEFGGWDTTVIPVPTLQTSTLSKVPGRTDYGEFTGTLYLINADAGVAEMITLAAAKTTVLWQVQLPDGTSGTTGSTYDFTGFVSNIKPGNFTGEDAATMDFTIAISGPVTVTAAT